MIDFLKQTPSVYSQSRDYQLLSKLFDAALGSSKSYSDMVYSTKFDKVKGFGELKCINHNFVPKMHWEDSVLHDISLIFKTIMRNKGTLTAVRYTVNCLLKSVGLASDFDVLVTSEEMFNESKTFISTEDISTHYIYIGIPKSTVVSSLIRDIFRYILPIGVNFRIIELSLYGTKFNEVINMADGRGTNGDPISPWSIASRFYFIEDKNLPIASTKANSVVKVLNKNTEPPKEEWIVINSNQKNVGVRIKPDSDKLVNKYKTEGTSTEKDIKRRISGNQINFNKVIKNDESYKFDPVPTVPKDEYTEI